MSLVTIGLDFGTSSVKCIARPSMGQPRVLRSPSGAVRWRSMLGRVREGSEAGRLLLFEECDHEQWRFSALLEPNLKLALLAPPTSPAAEAIRDRWQCEHYALPTLLLGAALHHALGITRAEWPNRSIHVFCGAPVAPTHPPEQTLIFERALHAANMLAQRWGGGIPTDAYRAVCDAEESWHQSELLPSEEDRCTFVVPEAFAACEGVVRAGGGAALPIGRLCVVDMGGGTTDIAWVVNRGTDGYNPLRIESIDVAGERLEAVIAAEASRRSGRRVTRQDVWRARNSGAGRDGLFGDGWSFRIEEVRSTLHGTMHELVQRFRNGLQRLDPCAIKAPPTRFVLVGGATQWEPLSRLFLESMGEFHERAESVSVAGYGLVDDTGDAPMAVALGLSSGHTTLDLERWDAALDTLEAPDAAGLELLPMCPCNGLVTCCPQCGGSGTKSSEGSRDRFYASIDPFVAHAFSIRCPYCRLDFPRDRIFQHVSQAHPESQPVPQRADPPPARTLPELRIDEIRAAMASGDTRRLSDREGVLVSDLQWLERACFGQADDPDSVATRFLKASVCWAASHPWGHLPRAVAFGILRDQSGIASELKRARASGFPYCHEVHLRLSSDRPTRLAEAWECAIR
jgi:hypothetical protein